MTQAMREGIWNYGDLFDGLAGVVPPAQPALVHGTDVTTWRAMVARTNNVARALLADGAAPGEKLALYLRNHPAYLEATIAGFKARQVHVNVNYRYAPEEVRYILENSDATTVVFGREFASVVTQIRDRLAGVRRWLSVDDGASAETPAFASPFESWAPQGDGGCVGVSRSPAA